MDVKFLIKPFATIFIIILCSQIGRKAPALAGLLTTAPIITVITLWWLWSDDPGNFKLMTDYTTGAIWGIIPTILSFIAAFICFKKQLPILSTSAFSFAAWLIPAIIHQILLKN